MILKMRVSFFSFLISALVLVALRTESLGDNELSSEVTNTYLNIRSSDNIRWREWNEETLLLAKESQKLIVLSISHQENSLTRSMGKESFANETIVELINDQFIAIAVDKNTLPQVAAFYAAYVRSTKQITGWPLTLFLTPDLLPIEGGGYYPAADEWGNKGLSTVLLALTKQWESNPEEVAQRAARELEQLNKTYGPSAELTQSYTTVFIQKKVGNLQSEFDPVYGGFGLAPKSLPFLQLQLIKEAQERLKLSDDIYSKISNFTSRRILEGAVHDPIGGGFFSESIEDSWSIPLFEKSVSIQYDAVNYLSGLPEYNNYSSGILQLLLNEFFLSNGLYTEIISGFTAEQQLSEDAVDGYHYSWSFEELKNLLSPEELSEFVKAYSILEEGNLNSEQDFAGSFNGRNILRSNAAYENENPELLQSALGKIRIAFSERGALLKEPTVSLQANAAVLFCLAQSSEFSDHAVRLEQAMWHRFFNPDEDLLFASETGQASSLGYALFIQGLLAMGDDSAENEYNLKAKQLQLILDRQFLSDTGLYFIANKTNTQLPLNLYALSEGEFGSANSVTISNLRRLAELSESSLEKSQYTTIPKSLPKHFQYQSGNYPHLLLQCLISEQAN